MRMRLSFVLLLAALATASVIVSVPHVGAQQPPAMGDPNAQPAPFNPQLSALMNMLIQPRHAKLGLAGQAQNWPLAGYMLTELRQGFVIASRAVPRWKGLPVGDLFEAAVVPSMSLIDFAIKANEPRQFTEAYGKLTTGCNNCHATTDHAFVVIKPPESTAAFPNQDFAPKR